MRVGALLAFIVWLGVLPVLASRRPVPLVAFPGSIDRGMFFARCGALAALWNRGKESRGRDYGMVVLAAVEEE